MQLFSKIESILFYKGEPMSMDKLSDILKVSKEEIAEAVSALSDNLKERGIVLQINEDKVSLGTHPQMSELIEAMQKEDLNKELSKSSLETLSIILYKNGIGRAEIDYIRGVNSSFILRALSIRGLIEKSVDPKDSRKYIYKPSFELLSFMGLTSVEALPEYEQINQKIEIEQEKYIAEEKENI